MRLKARSLSAAWIALSLCALPCLAAAPPASTPGNLFTVEDLLDVVNVGIADLSRDGRWLALTATSLRDRIGIDNSRYGDPTYVSPSAAEVWIVDTRTGDRRKLFPEKRQVRGLRWSPDASRLAFLVLGSAGFEVKVWQRESNRFQDVNLPSPVVDGSEPEWTPDGGQILLALRSPEWSKQAGQRFQGLTAAPIVVLSSKEPFLAWDDLRRLGSARLLALYDLSSGQTRQLLPESKLTSHDLSEDGRLVSYLEDITKKTDYDVIFGRDNRLQLLSVQGGEPRTLMKSTKGLSLVWSRDRRSYAYAKEGDLYAGTVEESEARQLTGKKAEGAGDKAGEAAKVEKREEEDKDKKERFTPLRFSPTADRLVASSKQGFWLIDTASGAQELFLKTPDPEEDREAPRRQVLDWSPDGSLIYLSYASRTQWERGLIAYDVAAKEFRDLVRDARIYSGFRQSWDGSTFVFQKAEGNRPSDVYVADAAFRNVRRLTDANPGLKDKKLSRTELVSYLDVDGKKSHGVLYYPVDYEAGKKYPTVFNVYEQFFDDTFNGTLNVLTANGYAVMQPSVNFETGFPGEAWVKGVTAAANRLIEMGVADADRLGVQGTSYGGYATNLLITQTTRFRAAVNISGKVNMVSFYTDSPRLGVRNTHAPEKSQDRIGATLWQQPQKYLQHSAVLYADRIKTPLLLITGEQDHNVPARQAMEMYYALRRLGKEVEWVSYTYGGHGMPTTTVEEVHDYHQRIVRWYDDHLKGDLKKKKEEKATEGSR